MLTNVKPRCKISGKALAGLEPRLLPFVANDMPEEMENVLTLKDDLPSVTLWS